jgi:hypothetical protein
MEEHSAHNGLSPEPEQKGCRTSNDGDDLKAKSLLPRLECLGNRIPLGWFSRKAKAHSTPVAIPVSFLRTAFEANPSELCQLGMVLLFLLSSGNGFFSIRL